MRAAKPILHHRDHEPGGADEITFPGRLYIDHRVLDSADATVVFDSFPSDLSMLELIWRACSDGLGDPGPAALGCLVLNDDTFESVDEEYFWTILLGNFGVGAEPGVSHTLGQQSSIDDTEYTSNTGAFAWIPPFAEHNTPGTGKIRFPNYAQNAMGNSQAYDGQGMSPKTVYEPDVFGVGGYRQSSDPIAKITLGVFDSIDETLATPYNWYAGSSFTLIGYPAA